MSIFGVNHEHLWLTASSLLLVHQNVSIIVLQVQNEEALSNAAIALDNEEKHYGLLKRLKQIALQ